MGASPSAPSNEPTLYQKATGTIAGIAEAAKNAVAGVPGAAAATAPPTLTAPESAGVTAGGGRRHRTRKGRKGRKTRRGHRKH